MDYKYIECLVERYFQCQTTLEEERILRDFFLQEELPEHLRQYQSLFLYFCDEVQQQLPSEFDARLQSRIQELKDEKQKGRFGIILGRINRELRPFYKAVASIALIITVAVASTKYFDRSDQEPINYNYAKSHTTQQKDLNMAHENTLSTSSDSLSADSTKIINFQNPTNY